MQHSTAAALPQCCAERLCLSEMSLKTLRRLCLPVSAASRTEAELRARIGTGPERQSHSAQHEGKAQKVVRLTLPTLRTLQTRQTLRSHSPRSGPIPKPSGKHPPAEA